MKKGLCILLVFLLITTLWPAGIFASSEKNTSPRKLEIVAGGYEIDMEKVPSVYFEQHKDWQTLFETAWNAHKSNIRKASTKLNPNDVYYVDEAFDESIFLWDTMLMMFDKYAYNQFPTLSSIDNFYYQQTDSSGEDNGYICRRIGEKDAKKYYTNYKTIDATNPPLAAWAEWEQYLVHGDAGRFSKVIRGKSVLQRLDEHYQFIKRNLRVSTGLYTSNGQGNGLDNTPNQGEGQSANDLSLQQVQHAHYISLIAGVAGDTAMKQKYETEKQELTKLIQDKLWSEQAGFFYNLDKTGTRFTEIATPTGLWALAAGVATPEQAERMIKDYSQNSEKMYRPNGLATVNYDYKSFKPTGGYWNGAMWSPTSYVFLSGLRDYGYDDLAFTEAVRHVDALARICVGGAYDRDKNWLNTLWENYSSEYDQPGSTEYYDDQPSRPNFVGWAGALGIGAVIEDIIGLRMNAPQNTLNWNMHLTEKYGLNNLYMGGNTISLLAHARKTATSECEITVTAEKPFTLVVENGQVKKSFEISAGQNTFTVPGEDSGEGASLSMKRQDVTKTGLQELVDFSGDHILFGADENPLVKDGLKNQIHPENGTGIFNVNTIGYRNAWLEANPMLETASGKTGLRQYSKMGEKDGFMLMAPAHQQMQTLKLVLGIKDAKAQVEAALTDGSVLNVTKILEAGQAERSYVVEIPFRAASADKEILVKYTILSGKGKISLKGASLSPDGTAAPKLPETIQDFTLAPGNRRITVSSEVQPDRYDSYRIYYGTDAWDLNSHADTESLPVAVSPLKNNTRYYVGIAGIKDGIESELGELKTAVPMAQGSNDADKAMADWETAKQEILNGNADFDHVEGALNFSAKGQSFGSSITFDATPNPDGTGIYADGSVILPGYGQETLNTHFTATITNNSTSIKVIQQVKVLPAKTRVEIRKDTVISTKNKPRQIQLDTEGTLDWMQFNNIDTSKAARKTNGQGILSVSATHGTSDLPSDAPFTYTDAGAVSTTNKTAVMHQRAANNYNDNIGRGFSIRLAGGGVKKARVYLPIWGGDAEVSVLVNGKLRGTQSIGKDTSDGLSGFSIEVIYDVPLETDVVEIKAAVSKNTDTKWGGCHVGLAAITLGSGTFEETPVVEWDKDFNIADKIQPAQVDLTQEGSLDWKLFNSTSFANTEHKKQGSAIQYLALIGNITKENPNKFDAGFSFTDGTNKPSGSYNKGMVFEKSGKGISFSLPYGAYPQQLTAYVGAWSAEVTLKAEWKGTDGETQKTLTKTFDTGVQQSGSSALYRAFVLNYQLAQPEEKLDVSLTISKAHDNEYGNFSLCALTLGNKLSLKAHDATTNGVIRMFPQVAGTGNTIQVVADPEPGYRLREGSLYHTDELDNHKTAITGREFAMPDYNAVVSGEFEKVYSVYTAPEPGCTVTPSQNEVAAGEEVSFTIEVSDTTKRVDTVSIISDGGPVEFAETEGVYSFNMPAQDAIISVSLEDKDLHSITVQPVEGVQLSAPEKAKAATTVDVSAILTDSGKELESIQVESALGTKQAVLKEANLYTFEMPDSPVTLKAVLKNKETPEKLYKISCFAGEGASVLVSPDAPAGQEVSFKVTLEQGKELQKVEVTAVSGNKEKIAPETGTELQQGFQQVLEGTDALETTLTQQPATDENNADGQIQAETQEENSLPVTGGENGVYSFTMPESDVLISVATQNIPAVKYPIKLQPETGSAVVLTSREQPEAEEGEDVLFTVKVDAQDKVLGKVMVVADTETSVPLQQIEDGYSFIMPGKPVSILVTLKDKVIFRSFTYTAQTGGRIEGSAVQSVAVGKQGTPVTAVADSGYRFVKWSDGSANASRMDTAGGEDLAVKALFEKEPDTPAPGTSEPSKPKPNPPAEVKVTSVQFPQQAVTILVKKKLSIGAIAYLENGKTTKVSYTSSAPKVVSVSSSGKITAIKTGKATITASAGDKKAVLKITVIKNVPKKAVVKSVTASVPKTIKAGQRKAIAKVKYSPSQTPGIRVTYKSSNKNIVHVDKNGMLTAKKKGTANITVKAGKASKIYKVTVK